MLCRDDGEEGRAELAVSGKQMAATVSPALDERVLFYSACDLRWSDQCLGSIRIKPNTATPSVYT